jgi:hypothetical protein
LNYTPTTWEYEVEENYVWGYMNKKKMNTTAINILREEIEVNFKLLS